MEKKKALNDGQILIPEGKKDNSQLFMCARGLMSQLQRVASNRYLVAEYEGFKISKKLPLKTENHKTLPFSGIDYTIPEHKFKYLTVS